MGGRSSSKTEQRNETTNLQLGIDGDNQGQVITGSGNSVTIESTDYEVLDAAGNMMSNIATENAIMAGEALGAAVDMSADSKSLALDVANLSTDTAQLALNNSQSATELAITENSDLANNAMIEVGNAYAGAGSMVTDMALSTNATAENMLDISLSRVGEAVSQALATSEATFNNALKSNEVVSSRAIGAVENANILTAETVQRANDNVTYLSESLTEKALLNNRELAQETLLINEEATRAAFDLVDNVTTDDTSQASIAQTKYMALAIAAVGLGMAFMRK